MQYTFFSFFHILVLEWFVLFGKQVLVFSISSLVSDKHDASTGFMYLCKKVHIDKMAKWSYIVKPYLLHLLDLLQLLILAKMLVVNLSFTENEKKVF